MNKTFILMLLLAMHTPILPESDILKTFASIASHKNTECIIGLILATTLCGQSNKFAQVLGVTLFLASLGLYASDYRSFNQACKDMYRSITR